MDDWVDYKMNSLSGNRIYELNKFDLPECNCLEKTINQAKETMSDQHM